MTAPFATPATKLACAGCGAAAHERPERGEYPFRCGNARAGDDVDHVVTRLLDPASVRFPRADDPNPFVTFRHLLHSYHAARARGLADEQYVALVRALDADVQRVDGTGFAMTPFKRHGDLTARLGLSNGGGVWVKDETGNVSGSHKARHLMGIMIYLRAMAALGLAGGSGRPLAIASCGNAALAAAVVARAARWPLQVFIPPDAPRTVVERLQDLAASPILCPRDAGVSGDPCYRRFEQAVDAGAIPFCCQGSANGMTIEGGATLGYEMVAALREAVTLDAIVVQVGGGALASAIVQAWRDAVALNACNRLPRLYTVQTHGAFPLKRAYDLLFRRSADLQVRSDRSADLQVRPDDLRYAATHRHEFMWPWEEEPRSIARGILDDETYDWMAVVEGMLRSGGHPVVVDETELAEAYAVGRSATGIRADHTGTAGLAGLLHLLRDGSIAPREQVAVIFSGVER